MLNMKHLGATVCTKMILYGIATVNNSLGGFMEYRMTIIIIQSDVPIMSIKNSYSQLFFTCNLYDNDSPVM